MANLIRVLTFLPLQSSNVEMMKDDLDAQQAFVGGYIEGVALGKGLMLICNDSGALDQLPLNFLLERSRTSFSKPARDASGMLTSPYENMLVIHGPAFFCRVDNEGECAPLTDEDIAFIREQVRE